jgi:hypothetical protein
MYIAKYIGPRVDMHEPQIGISIGRCSLECRWLEVLYVHSAFSGVVIECMVGHSKMIRVFRSIVKVFDKSKQVMVK